MQGCFVPTLVEIGPVVLEKKKMWNVYDKTTTTVPMTTTTTNNGQILIKKAYLSLQLWWAEDEIIGILLLSPISNQEVHGPYRWPDKPVQNNEKIEQSYDYIFIIKLAQ